MDQVCRWFRAFQPTKPAFLADRRQANVGTIAVGGITEAQQAEDILQSGDSDMIAMARELMWTDWKHAAYVLGLDDPYSYLPDGYAYRLRQREEQRK